MLLLIIAFIRALIPLVQTLLDNLEQEQTQTTALAAGRLFATSRRSERTAAPTESSAGEPVRTPSQSTFHPGEGEPHSPTSPTVRGRQTSSSPAWRHLDLRCGGYSHTRPSTTVTRCAWCGREPSDRSPVPDNEWQRPHRFMRQVGSTWQVLIPAPVPGA